jgi:C4-dicarboxylate-specific signal transduction histidine kinase
MRDYTKIGMVIGARALEILSGRLHTTEMVPFDHVATLAFDSRQLARWRVEDSQLPQGSIVRFRAPSLWRDYRPQVIAVSSALTLQLALIVGLLYQRRQRRRAEAESRRNLGLAADADRRSTMSALTGSIAHELSQPLGAILMNASTADRLVTSNRATPDALHEILLEICAEDTRATQIINRHREMLRSRELDKQPVDVYRVARESLSLLAHDLRIRQVQVDLDLPSGPGVVMADSVLLQQVFVNLVTNATDAMAETAPQNRRVTVRGRGSVDQIELSVRDAGPGVPASLDGRLFEPFVTTKPTGLGIGLTIVRTIVDAYGGQLCAQNNPEGGATFTVTLPRIADSQQRA